MKYGNLVLEKHDFLVTKKFIRQNLTWEDYAHKNVLETLDLNLNKAIVLDAGYMPPDVVRIYSKVTIVGSLGQRDSFRLVTPDKANVKGDQISVVSSLGASIIGFSKGDRIIYGLPGNKISFEIEKVEQARQKVELYISDGDNKWISQL
ncbi:GreA/GreB family elongation factor [Allomuricauda sp. CP2A]|jgi:regulator of nucleoside diphosphate kinase|uniref:GreA/GreB family elongation factor n=1 Tax=Allomuricauda sp. CP2A TaxID=1848189 RepID=UPI0008318DC2|nr:GreA/GreB family elongation factor [Muricauda sp. CP2A]